MIEIRHFIRSIVVVFLGCVCLFNLTQTFRENVKMLTINSICMRMRVCVWHCESHCPNTPEFVIWYLFVYLTVSFHRWKKNQCHMLCHVWTVDKLIIYVKRYSIWVQKKREWEKWAFKLFTRFFPFIPKRPWDNSAYAQVKKKQ